MSGRFVRGLEGGGGCEVGPSTSIPDSTLSCTLCKSRMQDARVLPGCLHSYCKGCLEGHAGGSTSFACPAQACSQIVTQTVDSLPVNSYFSSIASLDLVESTESLSITRTRRFGAPSSLLLRDRGESPPGPRLMSPPQFDGLSQDWRGTPSSLDQAWNPLNYAIGGDTWKPLGWGAGDINRLRDNGDSGCLPRLGGEGTPPGRSSLIGMGGGSPLCASCNDRHVVTSRCRDCSEDLCESCVVAHKRVKLTREHTIVGYTEKTAVGQGIPGFFGAPGSSKSLAVQAPGGSTANADVLRVFNETVDKAKLENISNCERVKLDYHNCESALAMKTKMEQQIHQKCRQVMQEIDASRRQQIQAVDERHKMLERRLEKIRCVKIQALDSQEKEIRQAMLLFESVLSSLDNAVRNGVGVEIIEVNKKAVDTMISVEQTCGITCGKLTPHEDDDIVFRCSPPELINDIANAGLIASGGFAPNCLVDGDGLTRGVLGKEAKFSILVKDHLNETNLTRETPMIEFTSPDGHQVNWNMQPDPNVVGKFDVRWRPHIEGEHLVCVTMRGVQVGESPFNCLVRAGRDYQVVGSAHLEFGREGAGDGELCRPWGVCCTPKGLICVADRSNNRIQIFNRNGTFHSKFGTEGTRNGQFNRPASVCVDGHGRLVVTDKDNHRMQIFTIEGEFLLKFGEKGSGNGQFLYPWDVACNSSNEILVSDTRNHRLQLFSHNGDYLAKYGFEGPLWKHFDSPRGVSFTQDNQAVVTDFNNHRLLVIKANFQGAQFLGSEGVKDGEFTRPNGVTVDDEGNIVVADSRNDRIQVFSPSGVFLRKFGTKGSSLGEFDRPCGVCMTPDGYICVVDFGNTRVQLF